MTSIGQRSEVGRFRGESTDTKSDVVMRRSVAVNWGEGLAKEAQSCAPVRMEKVFGTWRADINGKLDRSLLRISFDAMLLASGPQEGRVSVWKCILTHE